MSSEKSAEDKRKLTIYERLDKYTNKTKSCWVWTGACTGSETHLYGALKIKGKMVRAHRLSYERYVKKIPEKMVIDHICRNTKCINPKHLRVVTMKTNAIENSLGVGAINKKKIKCINGHMFDKENIRKKLRDGSARRVCIKCQAIYDKRYYKKKKALELVRKRMGEL